MGSLDEALHHLQQFESSLNNVTSSSPATKRRKVGLHTRLSNIISALPNQEDSDSDSQVRRPSQPPTPAQPPPLSPPKLTKKEAKTLRCRTRAIKLLDDSLQSPPFSEADFFLTLSEPYQGRLSDMEDSAMSKLACSFIAGTAESWPTCAKTRLVMTNPTSKHVSCPYIDAYTQNLGYHGTTSDVSTYLQNMLQCINAITFSIEVKQLGEGAGGTRRKTALYQKMYVAEGSPGSYETWKTATEAKVNARNRLADMYLAFGPIILFDMFWCPRNMEPNHRHSDFIEMLKELIKAIPIDDTETGVDPLSRYLTSTKQALLNLLYLLYPSLAEHVQQFFDQYPPNIVVEPDSDLDWPPSSKFIYVTIHRVGSQLPCVENLIPKQSQKDWMKKEPEQDQTKEIGFLVEDSKCFSLPGHPRWQRRAWVPRKAGKQRPSCSASSLLFPDAADVYSRESANEANA
ncbi:hypothetical protein B0H13DRAFT_2417529 [Mycena leptocephala]|nr:hypothetical protein B0H13DRAFT_2417529 [Mycena leptocephala]